ncbi:MAG TPA: BON domain-containing protein [Polyangiales bacterium]|nr:BON domain-containing protein [Polyangiales bacterium]
MTNGSNAVCTEDVQRSIEAALARRPLDEAVFVHVEVKDGCASLSGRVPSWAAWHAVHDAVQGMPGLRSVDDLLQVDAGIG